ncbi:MAG: hypothetical protein RL018_1045 [Pseudomonadota bacterium]|jgi:hypothetical protein
MNFLRLTLTVVVCLVVLTCRAESDFEKYLKMPGKQITELQKENAKEKALVRECIEYCRPIKVDGYKIANPADCKSIFRDAYLCQDDVLASVKLYTIVKNRFGEERSEVSTCGWRTHDYVIEAGCGKSSRRALELNNRKEAEPQFLIPPRLATPD